MSKLGRYAANRYKVENLTSAKTVEVHDCGTIFTLDSSAFAVTLPDVSSSGPGWWAEFHILGAPASANYTVVTNGSENTLMGKVFSTHNTTDGDATVGNHIIEGDTITFVDALAVPGDHVRVVGTGTHYICTAYASASTGITITQAS